MSENFAQIHFSFKQEIFFSAISQQKCQIHFIPLPLISSSVTFCFPSFPSFFFSFLPFSILPLISPSVTDDTFSWESYLWQLLTWCHRHISPSIIVVNISFQPFIFDFVTTFVDCLNDMQTSAKERYSAQGNFQGTHLYCF